MSIVVAALFIAWALFAEAPGAMATEKAAASNFIDQLSVTAFTLLRSKGLSLEQKEAKVRSLVSDSFDLPLIGKFVLGSSWRKATAAQRKEYLSLFRQFVIGTYSRRFGGYSGQRFQVVGTRPIGKNDILVTTKIARPSGPPIKAGWRVRSAGGRHKILDVMVAGTSMVITQRAEFRAVVRRQGVGGLIETLRMQVTKFSAQPR